MFDEEMMGQAAILLQLCRERLIMLATAESCTGGLISALLTDIPGSSDVVERGFVTYSNEAKEQMLGVPPEWFAEYGAVSEPVAFGMAEGALAHSHAQLALSCTGIAGPGGGSDDKPVGLVYIACAVEGLETEVRRCQFDGDRQAIRLATVKEAIAMATSRVIG